MSLASTASHPCGKKLDEELMRRPPPARLGSTWLPSPTHLSCCLSPAPSSGSEPTALKKKKKNRLMQLGKERRWAAGLVPQACLLIHQPPPPQQGEWMPLCHPRYRPLCP